MLFDKVQFLLLSSTRPTLQKESTVDACPFLRLTVRSILPLSAGSHLITEWYKRRLLVLYTNKTTLVVCSLGTRFLNWFLRVWLGGFGAKKCRVGFPQFMWSRKSGAPGDARSRPKSRRRTLFGQTPLAKIFRMNKTTRKKIVVGVYLCKYMVYCTTSHIQHHLCSSYCTVDPNERTFICRCPTTRNGQCLRRKANVQQTSATPKSSQ